jgi:hypothetical protein
MDALRKPPSNWVISAWSDPLFQSGAAIGQNLTAVETVVYMHQIGSVICFSDSPFFLYILNVVHVQTPDIRTVSVPPLLKTAAYLTNCPRVTPS